MKHSQKLAWVTVTALLSLPPTFAAQAATFSHTEIQQDKVIAIAVPRAGGYYNLLVLEQLSGQRACWQESGSNPTQVEPLLLNFDFSGICGRSTDSNGYSIRVAGQDLGMKYHLSIRKQQNELVLLGAPRSAADNTFEIGRTRGLKDGFLKIYLSPGWRFTKRSYSGKTLGHFYLHRDTAPAVYSASAARPTLSASSTAAIALPPSSSPRPIPGALRRPQSIPVPLPTQGSNQNYRLMVVAPSAAVQSKVRSLVPGSFRSSYNGQPVMQVGIFKERDKADVLERQLEKQGLKVIRVTDARPLPAAPPLTASRGRSSGILSVPSSSAPLGNARGVSDVYGRGYQSAAALPPPPPPSQFLLGPRYRVVVTANSSSQQAKVRQLVPGAFRSWHRGQRVMQVGSFSEQSEANAVIALMERNGFDPVMEKTQ